MEMNGEDELRIVLLGKTGVGKSSVGNTILGEDRFTAQCSKDSKTQICQREEKVINGRKIVLIDTPGIFDTNKTEVDLKREIISCLVECAPGPHVFIAVLKTERYTEENQRTTEKFLEYFTDNIFPHMIMIFTHGESLENGTTILNFIHQPDGENKKHTLKDLAEKCGGRVHVIDNKYWNQNSSDADVISRLMDLNLPEQVLRDITEKMESTKAEETPWFNNLPEQCDTAEQESQVESNEQYKKEYRSNRFQLTQLMKNVENILAKSKGQYYSNKALEAVGEAINVEVENILKEKGVKRETADMVETRRRARERVRTTLQRELTGVAVGALLGALLGVGVGLASPVVLVGGLIRAAWRKVTDQLPQTGGASVQATDVGAGVTACAGLVAGISAEMTIATFAEVGALAAGTATGIGAGAGAGILLVYGAVKGGAAGYKVSKTSDNPKQTAGKVYETVTQKAENVLKACWNVGNTDYERLPD